MHTPTQSTLTHRETFTQNLHAMTWHTKFVLAMNLPGKFKTLQCANLVKTALL